MIPGMLSPFLFQWNFRLPEQVCILHRSVVEIVLIHSLPFSIIAVLFCGSSQNPVSLWFCVRGTQMSLSFPPSFLLPLIDPYVIYTNSHGKVFIILMRWTNTMRNLGCTSWATTVKIHSLLTYTVLISWLQHLFNGALAINSIPKTAYIQYKGNFHLRFPSLFMCAIFLEVCFFFHPLKEN